MTCLRTLGVLSVTLSLVWSMTLETSSSRYLEEERSFKIDVNNSVNPFNLVEAIHYANNSLFNVDRIQRLDRNSSLVLNTTAAALIVSDSSDTSHSSPQVVPKEAAGESRKIKNTINKKSSHKDDGAVNNFIKTTIKEIKQNITKTRHKITTTKRPLKVSTKRHKTTSKPHIIKTISPITIKLTKPTTTKKPKVVSTPKSYGTPTNTKKPPIKLKLTTPSSNKKPKPTIKKILTKWKDSVTTISDLKQNWYEAGVPYPNPMPEITSSAPPFSISDTGSQIYSSTENIYLDEVQPAVDEGIESINPEIFSYSSSEPLQGVPPVLPISGEADLESVSVPSASSGPDTNPISTFNLDMLPSSSGLTKDSSGNQNGCPTVHISSSVLTPLQREECSDLNLVLNTHYHQNQDTRIPAISTYDGTAAAEDDVIEAIAEDPGVSDALANAGGAAQDSGASTYAGAPGGLSGGSSGGTGGSGGSGGDGGGDGGFKLPDLKPIFEATGYLMRGLWWLLQKLMNPWLYIVPIVLFFKLGFLGILTLFPWWIPFVFLYFSVRTDEPKNTVSHVTHKHKPVLIKHHDGWYWDQHTKTWKDVLHPHRHRRSDEEIEDMIDDRIIRFGDKYVNTNNRTRKRLKRR